MGEWMCRFIILDVTLLGGEFLPSSPTLYRRGKETGTHWIGDWMDPRTVLDDVEKVKILPLPGLELQLLGYPAHSQSLY
jgi:hypothetical protein